MSGGTPKGKSSAARGRRMAEKARGPRREAQPEIVADDPHADIGVEADEVHPERESPRRAGHLTPG